MIVIVFSCSLGSQCPCPHNEPLLFPAYPGSPPILLCRSLDLLLALWGQLRLWSGLTPACTCLQSPQLPPMSATSIVGILVVYSYISQMQALPSELQGVNPLILCLHREISLWSHCPWSSALVLDLPLSVGYPQASIPCPDKSGWMHQ